MVKLSLTSIVLIVFMTLINYGTFYKEYLAGQVVTKEKIDYAERRWNRHLGGKFFNREGTESTQLPLPRF